MDFTLAESKGKCTVVPGSDNTAHPLVRVILAEQLYRAGQLMRDIPITEHEARSCGTVH